MASANDSSKRRRLLGDASPDAGCLSDLPSGILTHVANYLALPSRALFASALTNQNSAASDERNTAIVGNEWTTLDFGDLEKDLAVKLSDGDISAVLQCIDAVNRVKKLKLTNCINITGVGLEPLRGSTIIEQIDLSLVGDHQSPWLSQEPPISREFVLSILDSIVEREGCSLRHVQYPYVWHRGVFISVRTEKDREFEQILRRYNEMLANQGASCLKCNVNLPPENGSWGCSYGSQNYTCYECLRHYCSRCTNDDHEEMLSYCSVCEKKLCVDCQKKKRCNCCESDFCVDCTDCTDFTDCSRCGAICKECIGKKCCACEDLFCEDCEDEIWTRCKSCEKALCSDCAEESHWPKCDECWDDFCDDCNEKKGIDAIRFCDDCDTSYCRRCRVHVMCQEDEGKKNCTECIQLTGPLLLEEVKKVRKENKEGRAENKRLKDTNEQMHDHINYLEKQLQHEMKKVQELEGEMKQNKQGEANNGFLESTQSESK